MSLSCQKSLAETISMLESTESLSSTPRKYVFLPNRDDVVNTRFRLRYSSLCDAYYRDWSDNVDPLSRTVLTSWERAVYTADSVHRTVDAEHGEVYLDRTSSSCTGVIAWRFDFGNCGLCVDQITLQLSSHEGYGGEVSAMLLGNGGNKCVRYLGAGDAVTFSELENSTILTLSIHLIGESKRQTTRLFSQGIFKGGNLEYPMDVKITLKHPVNTVGFPRVLLGLMYSNTQEIKADKRHIRENEICPGTGYLHIHLVKAVDLKANKIGPTEAYCKCLLLPDPKKTTRCRTNKGRRGSNPSWNEPFIVRNIPFEELKHRCLEFWVYDWTLSLMRKNALIGGLRLSLGQDKWTENAKTFCSPRIVQRRMFSFSTSRLLNPIKKLRNHNWSTDSDFSNDGSFISNGSESRVHEIPEIVVLEAISECGSTDSEDNENFDEKQTDIGVRNGVTNSEKIIENGEETIANGENVLGNGDKCNENGENAIENGSLTNFIINAIDGYNDVGSPDNGSRVANNTQGNQKTLYNGDTTSTLESGIFDQNTDHSEFKAAQQGATTHEAENNISNRSREYHGLTRQRRLGNSHSDAESAYSSGELEDLESGAENDAQRSRSITSHSKIASPDVPDDRQEVTSFNDLSNNSIKDTEIESKYKQESCVVTDRDSEEHNDGDEDSGISSREKSNYLNTAHDDNYIDNDGEEGVSDTCSSANTRSVSRTSSLRTITRRFTFRLRGRTKVMVQAVV